MQSVKKRCVGNPACSGGCQSKEEHARHVEQVMRDAAPAERREIARNLIGHCNVPNCLLCHDARYGNAGAIRPAPPPAGAAPSFGPHPPTFQAPPSLAELARQHVDNWRSAPPSARAQRVHQALDELAEVGSQIATLLEAVSSGATLELRGPTSERRSAHDYADVVGVLHKNAGAGRYHRARANSLAQVLAELADSWVRYAGHQGRCITGTMGDERRGRDGACLECGMRQPPDAQPHAQSCSHYDHAEASRRETGDW
jgi:hypothetical protein